MSQFKTLTLDVSADGLGTVLLDGEDIGDSISGMDIAIRATELTEIKLHVRADIKAEVRVRLENLGVIAPHRDADGACTQCGFEI